MKKKNWSLMLITFLVYVFLIGPLLVIAAASFSETKALKFPGEGFTLEWYAKVLTMTSFINAAKLSIIIAIAATAIALLLGLPAAYALNRFRFNGINTVKMSVHAVFYVVLLHYGAELIEFCFIYYGGIMEHHNKS